MQGMQALLPLLKMLAALGAGVLSISFALTYLYGQETARKRRIWLDYCVGFAEYQDAYDRHRFYRWVFLGTLILAIIVIESMVRIAGVPFELTPLKVIHYGLDAIFSVLLVLVLFPYNGNRNPLRHRKLVPWLAGTGLGVFVTGGYLYVQFCLMH